MPEPHLFPIREKIGRIAPFNLNCYFLFGNRFKLFLYVFLRDVNSRRTSNGKSPAGSSVPMLHVAAGSGKNKLLEKLISAGVNLNEKDNEGWPAIHYAILNGHFHCAALLFENGADMNCYTEDIVKDYCKAIREVHIHKHLSEDKPQ